MTWVLKLLWLPLLLGMGASTAESSVPGLKAGMTYLEAKTWHEEFLKGEPTKAERLYAMRELVRSSRLGDRGLQRAFRNFEGRYAIDPRTPGVERSVLMQMSKSTSQAKGYRRELLYASVFDSDPRYNLDAMNRQLRRSWGNTDADIVIRHRASGLYGRIEVKDYSLNSQSTNLQNLKMQIDKMARERQSTGQLQFWINRREVLPAVEAYAKSRGVATLGSVSTGRSALARTVSAETMLDLLDRHFLHAAKLRAVGGGGQVAFGALLAIDTMPSAFHDIRLIWESNSGTPETWLRLAENGAFALSGGSMVTSGSARLASTFATETMQGRLYSIGRLGGITAGGFFIVGEVFLVARYLRGDVNSREFRTEQWAMATTGAGSWGGSFVGTLLLRNPAWGSATGGPVGGLIGHAFGQRTANLYYERKFEKLDDAFGAAIYRQYGVNQDSMSATTPTD